MNSETDTPDADTDALDRTLTALFAEVRPDAGLEERAVQALRADVLRRRAFHGWQRKAAVGLAASVGLGLCGAAIGTIPGGLPFPGNEKWQDHWKMGSAVGSSHETTTRREALSNNGEPPPPAFDDDPLGMTEHAFDHRPHDGQVRDLKFKLTVKGASEEKQKDLTNPDIGLDSNLKAAVENDKVIDVNVDSKVVPKTAAPTITGTNIGKTIAGSGNGNNKYNEWAFDAFYSNPFYQGQPAGSQMGGKPAATANDGTGFGYLGPLGTGQSASNLPALGVTDAQPSLVKSPEKAPPPASPRPTVSPYLSLLRNNDAEKGTSLNYYGLVKPIDDPKPVADPQAAARKVIRSGDIEFEVESFDSSVAAVTLLVNNIKGGFVATVNSDKLPNGKVKGAIVVRVPPESLDSLVLDLRKELGKAGELKGQKIGSQDITKQYTDLESRLRAAKSMQERLLKIIAEGKGEIKQLLEAERELGVWRTKIEEAEGELRYYANLVSLSTLTIALQEKEMRVAAVITACEHVDAGLEVEDVTLTYREVMKAVLDAKGRVTKAELKQQNANQFNASIAFDVAPDAAGPMQDRLKQLGRVARLQIDLVQTADGGPVLKDTKVKRGDTAFNLNLYSLATIQPRETVALQMAAADVPASYRLLQDAVNKAKGRILAANLNEQDRHNVTAQFDFEIRRSEEAGFQAALAAVGDVVSRVVTRAVETDAVTDTKILYQTRLFNVAKLKPRETTTLTVEVPDVENAIAVLAAQVAEAKGRPVDSQTSRDRTGTVTAKLAYTVPLAAAPGLIEKLKQAGTMRVFDTSRDPQAVDGPSAAARISLTLTNVDPIVASDDGIMPQVRKGLTWSARVLLWSVTYVIVGACVLLPWAILGYGGYRLVRRLFRKTA